MRYCLAASIAVACVLLLPGCRRAPTKMPVRLIDQAAARAGTVGAAEEGRTIDSVWRRIVTLDPARFPLADVPERPILRFAIGLQPPAEGRVRFDVLLERDGEAPALLYSREIATPGWLDEEVDLGARDLKGAGLSFRKTLVEGAGTRLRSAHFAEPMLVPGAPRKGSSVVLISVDTLRADRIGAYGWTDARTPALDELAAEGASYANAYSASSWTYPSHASLLRGLYPASAIPSPVGPRPPTLGELFRRGGYLTAGFTGGGFMSALWGFQTGFDTYYQFSQSRSRIEDCSPDRFDGPVVFARAARWLQDNARHPFFLFVHTYDAHDRCEVRPAGVSGFAQWPDPGPSGRERFSRYYDDRIAAADTLIARFLAELDARGLSDEVVVAVTSDHGEALWEHGFVGHGCTNPPFEGMIKVPLIIRAPGHGAERGRRIEQPVSAVDVAPTLLALTGLTPPATMQGYVLPGLGLAGRPPSAPIFSHCDQNLAVRVGHYKLITSRMAGATDAVYDVERDPGETENVLARSDAITNLLRRYASEYLTQGSARVGGSEDDLEDLDDHSRERLRALGYVQ